jgi:hypothetical protein
MAFATGSTAKIAFIPEVTAGTTPATPAFEYLRVTGGGMRSAKATEVSEELRSDRNVVDEMLVGLDAAGTYPFELIYGALDDFIEGALFSSWSSNVIVNGTTRKTFTIEETLELGATDSYSRFLASQVNTLSLDISARRKITGSLGMMAQKEVPATTPISGATYTAVNDYTPLTASASVGNLTLTGGSITAPKVRRVTVDINNNLRGRPLVGDVYSAVEMAEGSFDVTGVIEAYFDQHELYKAVLDHAALGLTMTIGQVTGQKYTFNLPACRIMDGSRVIGGRNDDIIASLPYRAIYNSGILGTMQITRAVT